MAAIVRRAPSVSCCAGARGANARLRTRTRTRTRRAGARMATLSPLRANLSAQQLGDRLPVLVVIADGLHDGEQRDAQQDSPEAPDPREEQQADEGRRGVHARLAAREPGGEELSHERGDEN